MVLSVKGGGRKEAAKLLALLPGVNQFVHKLHELGYSLRKTGWVWTYLWLFQCVARKNLLIDHTLEGGLIGVHHPVYAEVLHPPSSCFHHHRVASRISSRLGKRLCK